MAAEGANRHVCFLHTRCILIAAHHEEPSERDETAAGFLGLLPGVFLTTPRSRHAQSDPTRGVGGRRDIDACVLSTTLKMLRLAVSSGCAWSHSCIQVRCVRGIVSACHRLPRKYPKHGTYYFCYGDMRLGFRAYFMDAGNLAAKPTLP